MPLFDKGSKLLSESTKGFKQSIKKLIAEKTMRNDNNRIFKSGLQRFIAIFPMKDMVGISLSSVLRSQAKM